MTSARPAVSSKPARPRHLGRSALIGVTAAAVACAPLLGVATATPAAAAESVCAVLDDPIHLAADPSTGRTLLSPWQGEIDDAARHGFTEDLGVAMYASLTPAEGLRPVYRMYQPASATFLWTMSDSERASAERHYGFETQKVDFYASPAALDCTAGVVRFDRYSEGARRYALTANETHVDRYEDAGWGGGGARFFAGPADADQAARPAPAPKPEPAPAPKPEPAPAPKPGPAPAPKPAPEQPVGTPADLVGRVPSAADVGAGRVGSASYPVPSGALFVAPNGNDSAAGTAGAPLRSLERAVERVRPGQTIVLRGGVYNSQVKFFTAGVTIQNYPGEEVWLDGSLPVGGFTRNGQGDYQARWTHEFIPAQSFSGEPGTGYFAFVGEHNKMAAWPDQVFLGGRQLWQVESNPGPGEFARDYDRDLVILGEDPGGREVRASSKEQAMFLGGADTTVRGIGIRRYASGLKSLGTVYSMGGNLTIENVVVEDSASTALNLSQLGRGDGHVVRDTTITRAGMVGIAGNGLDDGVVERNLIVDANWAGFNSAPNAAGMKIGRTQDVTIRNNVITGTGSSGIWLDESVAGFRVTGNRVTDGSSWGVMAELSGDGVIAENWLVGNDSGINLYDVSDVDVVNNLVDDVQDIAVIVHQDDRRHADPNAVGHDPRFPAGTDPRITWYVDDVNVHNNVFGSTSPEPWFAVQVRDTSRERAAAQMGVSFQGNAFVPRTGTKPLVGWGDARGDFTHYRTLDAWQAAQGAHSSNNRTAPDGSAADLDDWAAKNLPVVSWPGKALEELGLSTSPGYRSLN